MSITNTPTFISGHCPKSETNLWVNLLAVVVFFATFFLLKDNIPAQAKASQAAIEHYAISLSLICMLLAIIPIFLYDVLVVKVQRQAMAGLVKWQGFNIPRIAVKLLGLAITFAVIVVVYWLFPEYGDFYSRYFKLLHDISPFIVVISVLYILVMDGRMENPEDGYWQVGQWVLGRWHLVNRTVIGEHARQWLIKAFFLPLMLIFMFNNMTYLINLDYSIFDGAWARLRSQPTDQHFNIFYDFLYTFLYTVDVVFAAIGYAMTFKFLNSHIRSAEPTFFGWVVCIICYPPFWAGLFYGLYFAYDDNFKWGQWLVSNPALYISWGCLILVLIAIYSLATVCLGYRFSNLTYRGLVTNGPYRFTKHPAYIAKNLTFWLISIPFIPDPSVPGQGGGYLLKMCLLLLGVNIIYFLRARTEENHLSNYPEYVEYANWINEHGIFRKLGQWLPCLRYDEARAQRSGSIIWQKRVG